MSWNVITRAVTLLTLITGIGGCQRASESRLGNLYVEDVSTAPGGNSRRHQASREEALWTVSAQGCSGILLSPRHLLLADHCRIEIGDQLRSGWAVVTNGPQDLRVTRVIESDARLDYALLEVQWSRPMPAQQVFPPLLATDPSQVFTSTQPNQGDYLFTVGFPDDKVGIWSATYAEGQAKSIVGSRLFFNIGIINGNSGGGVLKKDNRLLVAIATGGTRNYGEEGWDKNDKEQAENWNFGTPLWEIYRVSPELQSLYPRGQRADLAGTFVPRTQLYVALETSTQGQFLWITGGHEVEKILICPSQPSDCSANQANIEALLFQYQRSERRFYRRAQALTYTGQERLHLIALDRKGELVGSRRITLQKGD